MTISEHDHEVIAQLEERFTRSGRPDPDRYGWTVGLLAAGFVAILVGAQLDHAIGFLAAAVGLVAASLGLGHLANVVAQHLPGSEGRRLTLRRWSGV